MWKLIGALIAVLVIAIVGLTVSIVRWLDEPNANTTSVIIEIERGTSLAGIAMQLHDAGVLDHPHWFRWYARISGLAQKIHSGEYELTPTHSPRMLLSDLATGRVVERTLALIEGWTLRQAVMAMRATDGLIDDVGDSDRPQTLQELEARYGNAEGWLFPDTYRYRKGATVSSIVDIAYAKMQRVLEDEWNGRAEGLPYETLYEALIMASIVEKETGVDEDRPNIAQVFVSRLELGMRLQSDPTVIYGLGDDFDGDLTREHLRAESPYNSYRRAGLPPTPISLPGLASIRAALHPASGDYLYFVARGDGRSEFNTTLEGHQAAVRRYQLNIRSASP